MVIGGGVVMYGVHRFCNCHLSHAMEVRVMKVRSRLVDTGAHLLTRATMGNLGGGQKEVVWWTRREGLHSLTQSVIPLEMTAVATNDQLL